MERFDVRRGMVKEVNTNGGLGELARDFFDDVEVIGENSFRASHGIMTAIDSRYENGALIVDVTNVPPDFEDPDAMEAAMDARKRWTNFLDQATGYNSKQRGDKAKEWAKKAAKAKSAISSARHFMEMTEGLSEDKVTQANALINEIEALLDSNDNTKAAGRAGKLNKMFN
ncbi:MAG: DUF5611 family protein [Candidatus Thalassarchaeaceae archaeon]|jgi:hypothetical protein|nr:DUF5611 family protein [Candidatus Thalassarchaeaceae archaeon]MDP6703545.1 DUF5611 family protein [Candidatus Thalassarchaeaceae archaeon]MDP7004476.1 DUF5611 family protein [Candidatus Thalassarchaeaceae archaeon]